MKKHGWLWLALGLMACGGGGASSGGGDDDLGDDELDLADDEHMEKLRSMMSRPTPWVTTRTPPPAAGLRKWSEMDVTTWWRSSS